MSKTKKIFLVVLVLLVIATIIVVVFARKKDAEIKKERKYGDQIDKQLLEQSEIDMNDEAYEGMTLYQEGNDLIIEGEDGSRTIEASTEKSDPDMKELSETEQKNYEIKDVKVEATNGQTLITGKVTNNNATANEVIVNIKFYSEENRVKGAASVKVSVNSKETKDFSMIIQDDVSQYKYEIIAEYAN